MTQSVSNILILFLRFQCNIILVSLIIEMFSNWSVKSLLLPLFDMLEVMFLMEGSICYKSVLIWKTKLLTVDIISFKSEILKFWFNWSIFINVCINSSYSMFIWSVEITNGLPDFFLDFQVILEVFNYIIVWCDGNLVVVLTEFWMNIFWWFWILVW